MSIASSVFNCIVHHYAAYGTPPSVREIAALLGYKHFSSIYYQIKQLVEWGYLQPSLAKARAFIPVRQRLVQVRGQIKDRRLYWTNTDRAIWVSPITFPAMIAPTQPLLLEVTDFSFLEDGYLPGDLLLVTRIWRMNHPSGDEAVLYVTKESCRLVPFKLISRGYQGTRFRLAGMMRSYAQ